MLHRPHLVVGSRVYHVLNRQIGQIERLLFFEKSADFAADKKVLTAFEA